MKPAYQVKLLSFLLVFSLMTVSFQARCQDKNVAKAEEALKKAANAKGEEKQDLLKRAQELFEKSGMETKEAYAKIGDALVEAHDYTGAQTFYGRAGGDYKKEGFKKMGEAYLADAPNETKNEAKVLKKALDAYTKSGNAKEGYTKVGDYYLAKNDSASLQIALDNYILGGNIEQVNKIAGDFYAKGPDYYGKAALTYEKTGTPEGYKKAGDIYWANKDTSKAYAAYDKGNYMEGIKKYADALIANGKIDEGNAQYNKIADYYVKTKNSDGVKKLASAAYDAGDYAQAANYYEKIADQANAEKSKSYAELSNFNFDEAIKHFEASGDAGTAKGIKDNLKILQVLPGIVQEFDLIKNNQPDVGMETNEVLGKKVPIAQDQAKYDAYYKNYIGSVTDKVFQIAAVYAKVTDGTVKKVIKQRFLQYPPVRNILNADTFTKKKEKAQVKVSDIYIPK